MIYVHEYGSANQCWLMEVESLCKDIHDMSMSMGVQIGVGWWKWNLKLQDIHDMSMSMGVEIGVGWQKWNLSARHSWYVHEYWSANQCWSVMTKASKPGEVQVIQPHWRSKNLQLWAKDATWLLAGYYIFEHLWSGSLPVHEQIITCSLIWFEHDQ